MNLKNKTTIVTGVSKGIGLATVKMLLQNQVRVAGWSRSKPDPPIGGDKNFKFYKVDVGNAAEVKTAYDATIKDFGSDITILINNAGLGYEGKIEETTDKQWLEMFQTNVTDLRVPEM